MTDAPEKTLVARAAEVSRTALRANAAEVDETGEFPHASVAAIRAAGLLPLTVPRRFGGHEASLPTICRVAEELGAGCASTALVMAMHWISLQYLGDWCLEPAGSAERHRLEQLRESVFADVVNNGATVASCYGEPGSGADVFLPFTRAEPGDGGWTVTGRKFGTLADQATYLACHAVVGSGPQAGAVVQFIVPARTPGVRVTARMSGLTGVRGAAPCAVEFEDCLIADEHRFLPPGLFQPTNDAYPYATLLLAAPYVGVARASIAAAGAYARRRTVQGSDRPLAAHADVRRTVAELVVDFESARALLYRAAAEAVPNPPPEVRLLNEAAKARVATMVTHVTTQALQMSGVRNLSRPSVLERLVRDSLAAAMHPPTTAQSLRLIGDLTLGADPGEEFRTLAPDTGERLAPAAAWWWDGGDQGPVTAGEMGG